MKRFLALLAATCFALVAWGQQTALVGLPEFGVTLTGTPAEPTVVNSSGQVIIGHMLRVFYLNSSVPMNMSNFKARGIWMHRPGNEAAEGLQPNQSENPLTRFLGPHPSVHMRWQGGGDSTGTPVKIVLDSVVFASGQMVGPDVVNEFPKLSERVAALREFATQAVEAGRNPSLQPALWAEMERLSAQQGWSGADHWKAPLAMDFRWAHKRNADQEAFDMAARVLTLPTIWR
jgi:hypothetical protein